MGARHNYAAKVNRSAQPCHVACQGDAEAAAKWRSVREPDTLVTCYEGDALYWVRAEPDPPPEQEHVILSQWRNGVQLLEAPTAPRKTTEADRHETDTDEWW